MLAEQKMTLWLKQPHGTPLLHPTAKARWRSRSVAAGNSLPKGLRALRVPQPSLSCKTYLREVELAASETNVSNRTFSTECPYSLAEILDSHFYPGEVSEWVEEQNL